MNDRLNIDQIINLLKQNYQYVFIIVGLLYTLAAIFDFAGINKYSTADSGGGNFKRFVFEKFGEVGYKVLNITIGIVLILYGVLALIYI
ncbi:hypothetical protein [Gemella morbillorum]